MKISKQSMKEITDLTAAVQAKQADVESALASYNEALTALKERVETERDTQQSDFDDKSEKWQESERGQAAQEWISAIENAMDALDEVAEPEYADLSDIEALSSEPADM